jgi:hypothetical protein
MLSKALTFIHSLARKSLTKGQGSGITKIPSAMQAEAKASEIFTNLVEAGLKPEMMDDFIKSEADVAKYLNILDAYKRERMKPIPADSPRGREITEALFGKRGEVVDMKGNVIPEGSGIMGGESIESLMKSGDVTKGTVTKKSKKVTDRDMFRAANENYITDTISKIKSMDPIEAMKEANKVIKREGPYKNLNQQQAKKILEDTEDHIFERDVTPMDEDFAAGGRVGLKGGGADMGAGSSKSSKSSGPAGGASSGGNYGGNNSKSDPDDNREQYGAQGQYQRPPSQQERNNQAAVREAQAFNQKKEETIKSVGSGALTAGSLFPRYIDNFQYAAPPGTNINKLRNLARQTASDKSIIDLLKNVYNDPDKFDPDFKRGSQIKASYPQYVKEGILSATGFKPTSQIGGGTNAARALLEKIGSIPGAQTLGRVLPGVGTVSGIYDVGSRLSKGDYFGAGLGALSAIPFVGIPAAAAQAAYDYREPLIEKSTNFFNKLQGAGQYQTGGVAGLLGERTGYAQGTDVFRRQKKEIPEEIKKKIFEMIMGTRNLGKVIENSERTKSRIGSEGVKAYGLAEGGRTGYKEGFTAKQFKRQETENLAAKINEYFDIKGSGSISGKNQIMGAPDGITANTETFNAIINMDIPIIEKINLLGSLGYGKDRFKVEKGDEELFLGEGGYKDRNIGLGFNQGGEGLSGSVIRNLETGDNEYQVKFLKNFASGGRVGLAGGMTRRAFLKLMGGVTAGIGAIKSGIMGVGKKEVAKKVVKEVIKTPPVAGKPEWFDALINKVILEGDDVTKKLATKDREIVHTKKLNDQESVTVTQDLDDGAIRVEYDSPDNLGQEPVMMQFKPGMADETTGGKKPADRFDVVETEPRYTGPDNTDIEFIGESGGPNISFIESDVTNLKTFATGKGPTMKEIVKSKKRKDLTRAVNENDYEAAEYLGGKYGDVPEPDFPDDYSGYASGGIAGMLGE